MNQLNIALVLLIAVSTPLTVVAQQKVFDLKDGKVEFRTIGRPAAIKIVGHGGAPHGKFTLNGRSVTGEASLDLNSLEAGISLRTKHMKEKYLQVDKFPNAKLTITKMLLPGDIEKGSFTVDNVPFSGKLMLHGVENPIEGKSKIESSGDQAKVTSQFSIKTADYKIDTPSFEGVSVTDAVDVTVEGSGSFRQAK
jgi:polyisoprenoid-binding protein YceI